MLLAIQLCPCDDPDCDARRLVAYGETEEALQASILAHHEDLDPEASLSTETPEGFREDFALEIYELRSVKTYTILTKTSILSSSVS